MPIFELLKQWAEKPSGFVLIKDKGWRNVQDTAANYLADRRRLDDPLAWEMSANRFASSVAIADRWCSDPDEAELIDNAEPAVPMLINWKNDVPQYRRRTA